MWYHACGFCRIYCLEKDYSHAKLSLPLNETPKGWYNKFTEIIGLKEISSLFARVALLLELHRRPVLSQIWLQDIILYIWCWWLLRRKTNSPNCLNDNFYFYFLRKYWIIEGQRRGVGCILNPFPILQGCLMYMYQRARLDQMSCISYLLDEIERRISMKYVENKVL